MGVALGWGGYVVRLSEDALANFGDLCRARGVLSQGDVVAELEAALERGLRDRALEIDARTAVMVFKASAAKTLEEIAEAKGVSFDEAACSVYSAGLDAVLEQIGGAS